jgi:hypothetical protein
MLQEAASIKPQASLQESQETLLPGREGQFPHDRMRLLCHLAHAFENDNTLLAARLHLPNNAKRV